MAQVKIGGHQVIVRLDESKLIDDCGDSDYNTNTISIDKALAPSQREASLLHEVIHFTNHTLNHTLLDSLSEQIYAFLKDNGLLDQNKLNELLK